MTESNNNSTLYSLWTIQEMLLQYYRTMFLTAESLVLAVAATVAGTNENRPTYFLVFIAFVLLLVWRNVTNARARDVSFIQELVKLNENGKVLKQPFTLFKDYQANWSKNNSYTILYEGGEHPFGHGKILPLPDGVQWHQMKKWNARMQLEVVLPFIYFLTLVAILLNALLKNGG